MSSQHSHKRQNLLTGEWVLVCPNRTERPWQGQVEALPSSAGSSFDANCYLCPGNKRAGDHANPHYSGPYAFDNDFPALSPESVTAPNIDPLFRTVPERGRCRVVCFSEKHNEHPSQMTLQDITRVLQFLADECQTLDADPDIAYVQAFENRGEMMGCSNAHPHAQIWATGSVPDEAAKELETQQAHWQEHGRSLLMDYITAEMKQQERLVYCNTDAVALVPYWAAWPFETLLTTRTACTALHDIRPAALQGLAEVLKKTLEAYDQLFGVPMPYSMGFHPRPSDGLEHPEWQFHIHLYPPLLRSATVRKHMVGFEMMAMPQRDLTPESAAARLRASLNK